MMTGMMVRDSEKETNSTPSSKRRKTVMPSRRSTVAEDIMTEVLLRLPIKSVVRFRAVCRSWATLLSSEEFCRLHRAITRAARVPLKLLYFSPTVRPDTMGVYSSSLAQGARDDELLFTLDYARGKWVEVLTPAPCHGLTLMYDALAKAYYICNAATRAVTRLPPSANAVVAHWMSTGLGFDARTREYKVVRLIKGKHLSSEQDTVRCEVYTPGGSHGDCWRPAVGGVPFGLRRFAASAVRNAVEKRLAPVFANGFLHWLIQPHLVFARPRGAIVYFSLMDETFRCVRSPNFPSSDFGPNSHLQSHPPYALQAPAGHLVEMDNQLCLVRDLRDDPYSSTLEIWRLLDYDSGDWSLDHHINLSGRVFGRELREPRTVRVIGSIDNGRSGKKIVIATCKHEVYEKFEKKVHTYDLCSQDLETILSITETSTSTYGSIYYDQKPPPLKFGLFEDCLAPMPKTDEEIALSSALSKAVKEILLRLPAKSVVQSKLICRQWLWLIKRESFMQSYFKHKNTCRRPKLMLVGKGTGKSAFSFAPLDTRRLGEAPPSQCTLLDTKVVCSKPCQGMNLVSTATNDFLYNPGTGFHKVYVNPGPQTHLPLECRRVYEAEQHAFAVGSKNVGLTFDPLAREHVMVEIVYHQKNFHSRRYRSACELRWCNSAHLAREHSVPLPPLPVNDMPPANVGGVLYWMSDPRLGRSRERAIVSFDITTRLFDTIPCPSCIAEWRKRGLCRAFVVELQGALCAVLADPVANSLDVWRLEGGEWGRACMIRLEPSPDYSLRTNVVVPLAVDPEDGTILLNTGRKIGVYDPVKQTAQNLYSLDEVPLVASEQRHRGVCQGSHSTASSSSSGDHSTIESEIIPLVPMLYEESLACYPSVGAARWFSFS